MKNYILSAFADEYADDFKEQLEALNDFEINRIELRFVDGINVADLSASQVLDVKKKLKYYGIGVSAIGSPIGKISLDDDMEAHVEKAKSVFETANILEVQNIRFFSFYPHNDINICDSKSEVYEKIERLLVLAEQYEVKLCHENEAGIYGESYERCLELMEYFKGRIKCVFDMGNFVLDGYNPYPDGFNALKKYIEYMHIKDALFVGAVVPPGKGESNICQILRDYKATMNSDTFITLEPHLQTFSGFNAIAGKKFDNPYKYSNRKEAFEDAVRCIKDILNNI